MSHCCIPFNPLAAIPFTQGGGGEGGSPSGPAGGDLTGSYPNPTIGAGKVTATKIGTGAVTLTKLEPATTTGHTLFWNGTAWERRLPVSADVSDATHTNTVSTIVKRDGTGSFLANQINALQFVGPLSGAVTGNVAGNLAGNATGGTCAFIDITAYNTLTLVGLLTVPQFTGNVDNLNPASFASALYLEVSSDADRDWTGLIAAAAGRTIIVTNIGAFTITVKNDTTSTAANRFWWSADLPVGPGESFVIRYNGNLARWVIIATGVNLSTGGGGTGAASLFGSLAPEAITGSNGDTYTDVVTGAVYKKSSGAWALQYGGMWANPHTYLPAGVTLSSATTTQRTTAFQAAIDEAENRYAAGNGGGLFFMGEWICNTDALTITLPIEFRGYGQRASKLRTTATTGKLLTIETSTPATVFGTIASGFAVDYPHLHNFSIIRTEDTAVGTDSIGLFVTDDASENFLTTIEHVTFSGFGVNLHFHNAIMFRISDCYFHTYRVYGIRCSNNQTPDHGDFIIQNSFFWSFYSVGIDTSGAAIRLEGGCAGAKIWGNKFWGSQLIGIHVYLNTPGWVLYDGMHSILIVRDNQFDGSSLSDFTGACVVLDSAYGRTGVPDSYGETAGTNGSAYAGNRFFDVQINDNNVNHWKLLDIRGLSGTYEDVHVNGGSTTNGGGVLVSGAVNRFSVTHHPNNNTVPFTGAAHAGSPDRFIRVSGTATNAYQFGNRPSVGYSVASDIPETLDSASIVAGGVRGSTTYLAGNNVWSVPAGGGGGGDVITDTATDTDSTPIESHTMDIGPGWTEQVGDFEILGGKIVPVDSDNGDHITTDATIADYTMTLNFTQAGDIGLGTDLSIPGVVVRYIDSGNHYFIQFGASLDIWIKTGGTYTLVDAGALTWQDGVEQSATIVCSGTSISVTVGATTVPITGATQGQTSTIVGLLCGATVAPTERCSWDNIVVTP